MTSDETEYYMGSAVMSSYKLEHPVNPTMNPNPVSNY